MQKLSAISWTVNKFESFSCSLCVATTTAAFDIVNGLLAKKRCKIDHVREFLELQVLVSIRDLVLTFCDLPPNSRTFGIANFI